jgi:hypothetical protein
MMNIARTTAAILACGLSAAAFAQQAEHRLGDHPAVIVKRLYAQQGYDYASKFYPHPAWLYLYAEAPPADGAADAAAKAKQKDTSAPEETPRSTLTAEVRR